MLRLFGFIISLLFFSCNIHEQPKVVDELKNYDTLPNGQRLLDNVDSEMYIYYKEVVGSDTLKGGYITCYGIDDSMKYFYLRHGDTLHLLNKTPIYTSTWSLGILESDYETFFTTEIDNGNGFPSSYQIFDKKTGKNILGAKKEFDSYKVFDANLFLIYTNQKTNEKPDSLFLYNVNTKTVKGFKLPENSPEYKYLEIDTISNTNFTISYLDFTSADTPKIITYKR